MKRCRNSHDKKPTTRQCRGFLNFHFHPVGRAPYLRCRGFDGGLRAPLALDRLGDQAHLDGLGADLDPADATVDQSANFLDVRTELAGGDASDLGPDTAEVFGFAAMGDLIPEGRVLTGKMTNAWH